MDTSISSRYDAFMAFVNDPALNELDEKYDPYLAIHMIDDIRDTFELVVKDKDAPILHYKLLWNTEFELPTELKKDILNLYNKYFPKANP